MEMTLTRIAKRDEYTIGMLDIDGDYFCDTLETTWRDIGPGRPGRKVRGKTAIPEGRYPVVITHSPRFEMWLPQLLHVPGFKGVRIHAGNQPRDTGGCVLVGLNLRPGMLYDSRLWLVRLKYRITQAKDRGEGVWLTVR